MQIPIKFLEDLLFYDGIQKVESDFLGNQKLLTDGYDYNQEFDYYMKLDMVVDSSNSTSSICFCFLS
jgi:hypothetical protein